MAEKERDGFRIVSQKKGPFVSRTRIRNPHYTAVLYCTDPGGPMKDMSVSVIPDGPNFGLAVARGHVVIRDPLLQDIEPARIEETIELLRRAADSALALERFLKQNFSEKGDEHDHL